MLLVWTKTLYLGLIQLHFNMKQVLTQHGFRLVLKELNISTTWVRNKVRV